MSKTALMKLFLLGLYATSAASPETLILKRAWLDKFKDRATIDASFTIDHADESADPAAAGGDMHVAGSAPQEVGLPIVAKLMNGGASGERSLFDLIHKNEPSGQPSPITGAWRLWFEHPAAMQQQFAQFPHAANTNPDHSFEIHPITKYAGLDAGASVDFVPGFPAHDAQSSFGSYEKMSISVQATSSAVILDAKKSGFNYAVFHMKLLGKTIPLDDGGAAVLANVSDASDEETVIASKIRMIFLPGTNPFKKIGQGGDGLEFDALGIPRLNLNAISTFINAAGTAPAQRQLPYEMIVVGLK